MCDSGGMVAAMAACRRLRSAGMGQRKASRRKKREAAMKINPTNILIYNDFLKPLGCGSLSF
jgi:hypothetical protein